MNANEQPRVPSGRRDGGQFTQADRGDQTQDLASTYGDSAMIDAVVAAGAEAHVAGISAERVCAYLEAVGRNDLLAEDKAAMRLSLWSGLDERGVPLEQKNTLLTKEQEKWLVEKTDEKPSRTFLTRAEQRIPLGANLWEPSTYVRLTEEGRRIALVNLLAEAHDRQVYNAQKFGFSEDFAEDYARWLVNYRLAEATRNLGKPEKESFDLLAATLLTPGVEKFVARPVPKPGEAYEGVARLGRAFEGTNRVGTDFTRYVALLKPRNAETEQALWDACARKRMDDALSDAWDAQIKKVKQKYGTEPESYECFYDPFSPQSRRGTTPLNYRPAKENPERLGELRKAAASGDKRAMATVAAWNAALKNAGSHNATMLSDGRSSVPFARNHVHRDIVLPYKPESMSVEGTRRGARYIYRYSSGLDFYRDGIAQFRSASQVSLNKKISGADDAAEFGDLLTGSRAGDLFNERAAADPAEIYDAGQRYASVAAIAEALPDNDENNAKLRRLLDFDLHDGIQDKRARATAIVKDITDARAEGVPEGVIRRLWGDSLAEAANKAAERKIAQVARVKAMNAAIQRRLHDRAAQRKAAAAQAR